MKQRGLSLENLSLQEALHQIIKNWVIVVCLTLAVFLGTTGLGMLTYTPEYTASATFVIRMKGTDAYSSLSQTSQMAAVYGEVFQSNALRNMISQSIGEAVEGTISCTQISSTNLLVLQATSPTPRQAYLFIHSAMENYQQVAGYVFSNALLDIVQEPSVPEAPTNASVFITYRIPLTVAAAVGSMALILLIYVLRSTVKSSAHASNLLDGTVLGTVPFERKLTATGKRTTKKKGVPALLLTSPLVSMNFAEASRRAAARVEAHMQRKQFQVLLVASVEENEGKSTVAANMAIAFAERGKRVMLLDGDLRKPTQWKIFDHAQENQVSLSDVLEGKATLDEAVAPNEKGRFWELFQYRAIEDPVALLNSQDLANLFGMLRTQMDYIVVDCSPIAAVADAELWMRHADTALLVVRQDRADVRVINDTVDLIWKNVGDFSGFLLNAFRDQQLNVESNSRYGKY